MKVLKIIKSLRLEIFLYIMNEMSILVVDSGSRHTILRDKRYFVNLIIQSAKIHTIAGVAGLIEGHGHAYILMPKGTRLEIKNALYSPSSKRSLLSFKDIRLNGFHLENGKKEIKNSLTYFRSPKAIGRS